MDLSSLEGPPIRDSRFTTPSWGESAPRIQLDTSVISPSHSDGGYEVDWDRGLSGLPPRPASTDNNIASPRHHRYSMIESSPTRPMRDLAPSIASHTPPRPRSSHASRPSQYQSTLSAAQPPPAPSSSTERRHPTRLQSHSFSSPHQLVWLDEENIWVLVGTDPATTTSRSTSRPGLPRLRTSANDDTATLRIAQPHPPSLSHARSMETFFANNEMMSPNYDDLPPPYERHIYDQQLAVGAGVSRWANVARRVNQGPS
ncbi:hypothetical protein BDV59DRAFT_198976 [Aspergillus ambiguus]|uniref:uncharacterized protein n=1 Tax=Aspergillus ambiguus TaxID=176160 RepID=UPI003CCD8504